MSKESTTNDPEISVVVPVYNSEDTLEQLTSRIQTVLKRIVGDRFEIIFINDGSRDNSWQVVKGLVANNEKLTAINLTRNFGQHNALMCGFSRARGTYILTLDDDLQNPPEEIPKMYDGIRAGYDVLYGIPSVKQHSELRNFGSEFVQFIYRRTFGVNVRISSFRIIRREIVQRILSYQRSYTFIDGLLSWFTTSIGSVVVEHHPRKSGRSGYSFSKLVTLALNMMTNFSIVPLQVASLLGIAFSLLGFIFGCYYLGKKIFFGIPVSGFTSIIVSITIFSGAQLLTVGMLGEYIGRLHINVSTRPQYAEKEVIVHNE